MAGERKAERRHSVPGFGGPVAEQASTRDGQQALRLHAGISVVAFVLCAFVAVVFFFSLGSPVLGTVFVVLAVACLAVLGWAVRTRRRSAPDRR
jgi:protein-S-isoprenylcysteine O-methyltransferase Ste14